MGSDSPALSPTTDAAVAPAAKPNAWPLLTLAPRLLGFVAWLILVQHAFENEWPIDVTIAAGLAALVGAAMLWQARRTIQHTLCSVPFGIVLLLVVAGATALGTFVPQNASDMDLEQLYGSFAAGWIDRLFLNEAFTSLWFGGLLAVMVLSLLLVLLRRAFWRMRQWGFLLTHGGMILVVVGAGLGSRWGVRGVLDLREGKIRDEVTLDRQDENGLAKRLLSFGLRLDKFEYEQYPNELRLVILSAEHHQQQPGSQQIVSLEQARQWTRVGKTDTSFRVREFYPEAEVREVMLSTQDATQPPAAHLRLSQGDQKKEDWLVAGGADLLRAEGLELQFIWSKPDAAEDNAWMERTVHGQADRHMLQVEGKAPFEVTVGESYTLPGTQRRFRVANFFPDAIVDGGGSTRSDQPNNPALIVVEEKAGDAKPRRQWLFAKHPGHGNAAETLPLKYTYESGVTPISNLLRCDGRTGQLVLASAGKEVLRRKLTAGKAEKVELPAPAGSTAAPQAVEIELAEALEHAVPEVVARAVSQEPKNPGVALEFKNKGETEPSGNTLLLARAQPNVVEIPGGLLMKFDEKIGEAKAFRSHVSVMEDGKVVKEAVIAVNDALQYGGYAFYQAKWDARDLGTSGLTVVKDPGLNLVYVGMVMICLGVLYIFYVRPRL